MDAQIKIYDVVMAQFAARRIPQRQVALESGVPFSTVTKVAQGAVREPSVHTIQRLYDYFVSKGEVSAVNPQNPSIPERKAA